MSRYFTLLAPPPKPTARYSFLFGPWPKCEFTAESDPDVGLERFQWIYSAGQSTQGLQADGARFQIRGCWWKRPAAPSSACKESQIRARSRELTGDHHDVT